MKKELKRATAFSTVFALVSMAGLAVSVSAAPSPVEAASASPASAEDYAVIIEKTCLDCHIIEKLQRYRKTQEEWSHVIETMITEQGVNVSPEEREGLAQYMSDNFGKKRKD